MLTKEAVTAVEFIEGASQHMAKMQAIRAWPGLSGAQRAAAMSLCCLEYLEAADVRVFDIEGFLNITTERASKLFDGIEHPPYDLVTDNGPARYTPSQRLQYGE